VIRKAFRMSVETDHQAEYIRRHNLIWRDLEKGLLSVANSQLTCKHL
jgi:L-rhamnose mutarotase